MKKMLIDAQITDGIPQVIKEEIWVKAISEAMHGETKAFLERVTQTQIFTAIDMLPENILDAIAAEMRLGNYRDSDGVEIKRQNIKERFLFLAHAGTVFATRKIAEIYFGNAQIREWFDYGGEPHHYKVVVNDKSPPWQTIEKYLEIARDYKRLSQVMEMILIELADETKLFLGAALIDKTIETIRVRQVPAAIFLGVFLVDKSTERIQVLKGA
jgi:phage tail P2-like protein